LPLINRPIYKQPKPLPINLLSSALVDPSGLKMLSHIEQDAVRRRISSVVLGPGSYNPHN